MLETVLLPCKVMQTTIIEGGNDKRAVFWLPKMMLIDKEYTMHQHADHISFMYFYLKA